MTHTHSLSSSRLTQGQELIHLPLKPSHMKTGTYDSVSTWTLLRDGAKKISAHIRSSNFPSHFTPQGKRLYSAIQMEPVKGGLYCTSAFPLLPEINSSSFKISFLLYNTDRFNRFNRNQALECLVKHYRAPNLVQVLL